MSEGRIGQVGDLVVPVLDVRAGVTVLADGSDRARYPALATPAFPNPDPRAVTRSLRALFPFPVIYVADLDALAGDVPQVALLTELASEHERIEWWIDAGLSGPEACARLANLPGNVRLVLGTETLSDAATGRAILARMTTAPVLSIDHRDGRLLGALPDLPAGAAPFDTVIDMNLDAIGTDARGLRPRHPALADFAGARRFLAGGIRHEAQLRAVRAHGFSGALCASALYRGGFTSALLAQTLAAQPRTR